MPTLETYHGVYLWKYVPALPAAIVFASLFVVITTAHTWRMVKTKLWFCSPFVVGGLLEVMGYIFRAVATNATGSLSLYLLQGLFLLLPPVLVAATLYMVYSRIVHAVNGASFSLISPRWTTTIFVVGDFLCLSIQGDGGGLLGNPKLAQIGDDIIVAGLLLQIVMFACFVACCVIFHRRYAAHLAASRTSTDVPWVASLNVLYASSVAILVRNVYRVVEFIMGQDGYLLNNEWPVYAFDGVLMLLVMAGFFAWYPSQLQRSVRSSMVELTSIDGGSTPPQPAVKRRWLIV